jgi:hypothetical protein
LRFLYSHERYSILTKSKFILSPLENRFLCSYFGKSAHLNVLIRSMDLYINIRNCSKSNIRSFQYFLFRWILNSSV